MSETCDAMRREILDREWDQDSLDVARRIIEHLDGCEACRAALREYDELRALLRNPDPPACEPIAMPRLPVERPVGVDRPHIAARRFLAAALAVSVLIAVVGWGAYFGAKTALDRVALTPPGAPAEVKQALLTTPEDIRQNVAVFKNVSETFDGRAGWVLVSGETAEMGLMPSPVAKPGKLMLLRIVLSQKAKILSDAELVIVPGEAARFSVPVGQGRELSYQVVTSGSRSSLLAELRRDGESGDALAALATTREAGQGQIRDVGRLVANGDDFDLAMSCVAVNSPEGTP